MSDARRSLRLSRRLRSSWHAGRFGGSGELVAPYLVAQHERDPGAADHVGDGIRIDQQWRETEQRHARRPGERSEKVAAGRSRKADDADRSGRDDMNDVQQLALEQDALIEYESERDEKSGYGDHERDEAGGPEIGAADAGCGVGSERHRRRD